MARRKWNYTELRVFILRFYGTQKAFCKANNINRQTLNTWFKGNVYFPNVEAKMIADMKAKNYDLSLVIPEV